MKLLLDENIPQKVVVHFPGHEVLTVEEMGWKGKSNGELLKLTTQEKFDVFITLDRNLQYQQNINKYPILIFLLKAINNKPSTVQPLLDKVRQELNRSRKPQLIEIE